MRKDKFLLIFFILISIQYFAASIQLLPLCKTCKTNTTVNSIEYCTQCDVCKSYAYINSGYCYCNPGYYINNQNTANVYCDRCHSSCLTCSGPLQSNCLTCSDRFDFVASGSKCTPPNNSTDQILAQAYNYYAFSIMPSWSISPAPGSLTTYCGSRTILGGAGLTTGSNTISLVYNLKKLPYHYGLRIKMGFYVFNPSSTTISGKAKITVNNALINGTRNYPNTTNQVSTDSCNGYNYIHYNIDDTFQHQFIDSVTIDISLTSNTEYFGIRQFYLIAKKCYSLVCQTCIGYNIDQCKTCLDQRRWANYSNIKNNTCLCKDIYYEQPFSNQCVDPCPSVPTQYYGNPTTRKCVLKCPLNYYGVDDSYRCILDCPVSSNITSKLYFLDKTNRKCVNTCPSTQPYAYQTGDRICYATCPTGTFASDAIDRRCVAQCPNTTTYKLYGYQGKCIKYCPNGTWADPSTMKCQTNCSNVNFRFKDNSTGFYVCVLMCPAPNFFGETTNYTCVQKCPDGTFGQRYDTNNVIIQMCQSKCNSPRWGLPNYNRKCVDVCPVNYWGQPTNRVCTNISTQCSPRYADNYTRECLAISTCSLGYYSDNSTFRCVPYCPANSYAHPISKVCQQFCLTPYFRDNGINACVTICNNGTYADESSTRTCVTSCNVTGLTPWADQSTRTCVNDCNNTINSFVADNTTWKCVYYCPSNYYADTTTIAPKCVVTCPSLSPNKYFADNSTGTGICTIKCSTYPRKFGDDTNGLNLCVDVCTSPYFGDQTGNRLCKLTCPSPYFAQNDSQRLCVKRCKNGTYGSGDKCLQDPKLCPAGQYADDYTNLCVNPCPVSQGTFGDPLSKRCVRQCPLNPNYNSSQPTLTPQTYYADISTRQCKLTCNASYSTGLFGNNNTRTCVTKCLDINSYAQTQTINRVCVSRCLPASQFRYANNDTKVCVLSISCQSNYYAQNSTQLCVQFCPNNSFAYKTSLVKYCIDICPIDAVNNLKWFGDIITSKRICRTQCSDLPLRFADVTTRLCVQKCPDTWYGEVSGRTCTQLCPDGTFSYEPTRRCVSKCPDGYYGDNIPTIRKCYNSSSLCGTGRFADPYLNLCVGTCTGPSPVNLFGYLDKCIAECPPNFYADSQTGTRLCIQNCPDYSNTVGIMKDLYGDPTTHTCITRCITPNTWADYQTRDCQAICSSQLQQTDATYSQNINMRCVKSINCPIIPSITFGDNSTRKCLSNCTNNQFGDPTTRNCVIQCPKKIATGTDHYYGDKSTGINLCIQICPSTPRLFGDNDTNLCVGECPQPYYGDQTGKRSCLDKCPIVSTTYYYAQNYSRICVKVCKQGTWALDSSRECVQDPFDCGAQWADNISHKCVDVCPVSSNTFADQTTGTCVPICPSPYYADTKDRKCVLTCPADYGVRGTFANNSTRICEQYCQQPDSYADPQTIHRHCVLKECSQDPSQAFADPSTKTCVDHCPVHPDLFGQLQNFTCINKCIYPYYGNTLTRRCELNCPSSLYYKLNNSQICVTQCPSNPDLYSDQNSGFCQSTCKLSWHRYPTLRKCVQKCKDYNLFTYNFTCVKFCPYLFYADDNGICVNYTNCQSNTYGQNTTTQCQLTCITGYAQGKLCVAKCDDGLYGFNKKCQLNCSAPYKASNQTNLCVSTCQANTYMENNICKTNCSTGYADPLTNICEATCTGDRYGDSTTNKCVLTCPVGYYRDITKKCLNNCSIVSRAADNITWNCQTTCSNGTWNYNGKCQTKCPPLIYGDPIDRVCKDLNSRPALNRFADNQTQSWVLVCPVNPLRFGDRSKGQCVVNCTGGQYADPNSRQCQTGCTNISYFADSTIFKCVLICPLGYYGNPDNQQCQDICTMDKFAYDPSHLCVDECPNPYYGYNDGVNPRYCVLVCPNNTFAEGRLCKTGCNSSLFADPLTHKCVDNCIDSYANEGTQTCQLSCALFLRFIDNSSNTCVDECPSQPDLYQQNDVCVSQCSQYLYADPTPGTRGCRSGCPQGLWAQPQSRRCLPLCKPGYFGRNTSNICSKTCLPGQFADKSTGFCQLTCPSPTYADSLLNQCVQTCSGNQFGQGRICVSKCSAPNYGNPLNRKCQLDCPAFDNLFAEDTTRQCVNNCSFISGIYADKHVRKCVQNCSQLFQYALDIGAVCVSLCPSGLFMDNSTKKCQQICDDGYAQPTSRYCVLRCFGAPDTYGHINLTNNAKTCQYKCLSSTENLYADNRTNLCVDLCQTPMYADPLSGNCVLFCPQGLYAEDDNRTCSQKCNQFQFADNYTRKCVNQCPTATHQTFGSYITNQCVRICPENYFARNDTKQCVLSNDCQPNSWADIITKYCVARCPSNPLYFGYNPDKLCLRQCPQAQDLYGEFIDQTCVPECLKVNGIQTYQDPISRTCVYRCPIDHQLWVDTIDNRCKKDCSGNQIRDNSTQMCVQICPSDPQYYADIDTKFCVRTCPNGTFASDSTDRVCTTDCSQYSFTFGDNTTNRCTFQCPIPYFADNSSYLCVLDCSQSQDYYADSYSRTCVLYCPKTADWITFADSQSRKCVTKCPQGWYGVNSTQRCLQQCPQNQYADQELNLCVQDCTVRPHFYKQINDRKCVQECPQLPVKAYKYDVNHSCVYTLNGQSGCPDQYYANPLDNMCTKLCPYEYYAEDSTKLCVPDCQPTFVADPTDRRCKQNCTKLIQYYAYDLDKICLQHCPQPYFNNNLTLRCTEDCPLSPIIMYRQYQTRTCVQNCYPPYFAHSVNQTCLLQCPSGFFAQQSTRTCVQICDLPYFADDSTNRCVVVCPQIPDYYGHLRVCGLTCPKDFYRDNTTRLCKSQCPIQPLLFADNSTNTCVKYCPADHNLFADNLTRKCVLNCSLGTFAQVRSRTCVQVCPSDLDTFADQTTRVCQPTCPPTYYATNVTKQCVKLCPDQPIKSYSHINKCLNGCPQGYYGENSTRVCRQNCSNIADIFADDITNLCVTTCPINFYAQNTTDKCVSDCPQNSFADPTIRKCVLKCPATQKLFADPSTWRCVSICPQGYYGDTNEWECLLSCPQTASGFRLDVGRLCVEQCPSPYFAFISTRNCVQNCGKGLYGDPVSRTCKNCLPQCPTCLSLTQCLSCLDTKYLSFGQCIDQCIITSTLATYANDLTRTCVISSRCPDGYYGYNGTKKCVNICPTQLYKSNLTKRCQNCPQNCLACKNLTYCTQCSPTSVYSAQANFCYNYCNSTHNLYNELQCVSTCPDGTYLDFTNIHCQKCNQICITCSVNALNCTQCYQSFKYQNRCVNQCPSNYYALNGVCIQCDSSVQSCNNPLSFTVQQSTENFKPVVIIKFNQEVTVSGDPKKFLKVKLLMKRLLQQKENIVQENENTKNYGNSQFRKQSQINANILSQRILQSNANLVNDGLYFDAQVLPDGTIKLLLDYGTNLQNDQFQVVFLDTSKVQTKSGQSLQSLQAKLKLDTQQLYPSSALEQPVYLKAGLILSILIILPLFALLLCSPVAIFGSLQTFQMISLFSYVGSLPPNLFMFLRELKITRLTFLPSIFSGLYQAPNYFTNDIPINVAQTQSGKLSFSLTAGGYAIFGFFYIVFSLIIFLGKSKYNNNRSLRNLFAQIYNSRIVYGIIHDFLWIFSLNIFTSSFMQLRFTDNEGDVAIGLLSMIGFLITIVYISYKLKKYNKILEQGQIIQQNNPQIKSNSNNNSQQLNIQTKQDKKLLKNKLSFYLQGLKQSPVRRYTNTIFYARKIIFSIIIASMYYADFVQAIILSLIFFSMMLYFIIGRPYIDNIRNILHALNQLGLMFISCGIIYYLRISQLNQPIGHKLVCGNIISYVIIVQLSIAIIWGYIRSYFYIKQLYNGFKQTQFYKLYMDEEYDKQLQKQIKQLKDQQNGQIQSVQITNFSQNRQNINYQEQDSNQIIKLKIKRKKIKSKFQHINKEKQINKNRYNKTQYIKLEDKQKDNNSLLTILNNKYQNNKINNISQPIQQQQQLTTINNDKLINQQLNKNKNIKKQKQQQNWTIMKIKQQNISENDEQKEYKLLQLQKNKNNQIFNEQGYNQNITQNNLFQMIQQQNEQIKQKQIKMKENNINIKNDSQLQSQQNNEYNLLNKNNEQKQQQYNNTQSQMISINNTQNQNDNNNIIQNDKENYKNQIKIQQQSMISNNYKSKIQQKEQKYSQISQNNKFVQLLQSQVNGSQIGNNNNNTNNHQDNEYKLLNLNLDNKQIFQPNNSQNNFNINNINKINKQNQSIYIKTQIKKNHNQNNNNNWDDLQNIILDQDQQKQKQRIQKKKIKMMIFEQDFQSESMNQQ